jgi:transposase
MAVKVIKQNVGVDISKDDFKVSFQQLKDTHQSRIKASRGFKNTLTGFKAFDQWMQRHGTADLTIRITLEATGVYYEQLVHFLYDQGNYHISVVLANQSKAFAKSLGINTKTDKVDARMLGQMGLERDLKQWAPMSTNIRTIKQLTRERVTLLDEKVALMNRMHAHNHAYQPSKKVVKRLKNRLQWTTRQIKQVEKEIEQQVELDPDLKERIDKVCQVKGLGLLTVATIVAETGGFELFTSRSQLTSFAGFDIVERQSGSSIKGKTRISKKGNRFIRRALYCPAMSVVRYETQFQQLYERVADRTAIKMKGLVAVQRKLLLLIYTLFKNNVNYDPDFAKKKAEELKSRQDTIPAYTG